MLFDDSKINNFWLYATTIKQKEILCKYIANNEILYLPSFYTANVSAYDMIFLYCISDGFYGLIQTMSGLKKNKINIKVFPENDVNNNYLNVYAVHTFDFISAKMFIKFANIDELIKGKLQCCHIPKISGQKIYDLIIRHESLDVEKKEKILTAIRGKIKKVPNEKTDSESESDNDAVNGIIPVMINPCIDADISLGRTILAHIKTCTKCEIINNNTQTDIFPSDATVFYKKVTNDQDKEYGEVFNAYQNIKKYGQNRDKNTIKVFHNQIKDTYDGYIFIVSITANE